jgi:hypothetical protein
MKSDLIIKFAQQRRCYEKSRSRIHGFGDFTEKPIFRSPVYGIISSAKSAIKSLLSGAGCPVIVEGPY